MLRRLLVWIVLLALPLQGIAGTAMVRCGTNAAHHAAADDRTAAAPRLAADRAAHDHAAHHAGFGHDAMLGDEGTTHAAHGTGASRAPLDHASTGHGSGDHDAAGHDAQDRDAPCCAAAFAITAALSLNLPRAGSGADLVYVPGALPAVYLEGLRRPPRSSGA